MLTVGDRSFKRAVQVLPRLIVLTERNYCTNRDKQSRDQTLRHQEVRLHLILLDLKNAMLEVALKRLVRR